MAQPHPFLPDSLAAARWQRAAPATSPWLHEEVARRMQERLQWMRQPPAVKGELAAPTAAALPAAEPAKA